MRAVVVRHRDLNAEFRAIPSVDEIGSLPASLEENVFGSAFFVEPFEERVTDCLFVLILQQVHRRRLRNVRSVTHSIKRLPLDILVIVIFASRSGR